MTERPLGSSLLFKIEAPRGRAEVDLRTPGVAEISYVGLATTELVEPVLGRIDAWITPGRAVTVYIDASALKSYDTAFRVRWTDWFRANRATLLAVHILFQSKIVEMGISIANSFIGGFLVPWSNRSGFEASLAEARRAATSSPRASRPG